MEKPISNGCKYRSHSASTVLIQQVPFSGLYFDEQVPSLQIRITVLFSTALQTPHTALPGFPATLPVFQNVSTHFYYPYAHSVIASFTRCRHNRPKLITYRATLPPSWENGTWQVPSQLSHSDLIFIMLIRIQEKTVFILKQTSGCPNVDNFASSLQGYKVSTSPQVQLTN